MWSILSSAQTNWWILTTQFYHRLPLTALRSRLSMTALDTTYLRDPLASDRTDSLAARSNRYTAAVLTRFGRRVERLYVVEVINRSVAPDKDVECEH